MPLDPIESFAQRVERLFQEALALPAAERAAFLAARAGTDERVLSAVQSLLLAAAGENSAWGQGALAQEAKHLAGEQPGRLDRYRLEERIGAGGMGVVYRAIRADDEFAKRVAIKIVQWEAGARLAERFRTERQILAGLEHPNIAHLLDGGTTEDGRPFLVMEYVDGVSLDKYLSAHVLSTKARLAMFRKICEGVACAHRNLVVHRDLKPSNILVTADGEPKLLDFGIAKLLDGPARTETGYGAMTPLYASPEQIANAPVTTASDTYSLGVILYEMLAGSSPYAAGSTLELTQSISTRDPLPMKNVDRDLETIVQMTLRKEPARRYASVDLLSADLQRYVDGFPVAARADTFLYRARKFVVRNRAWVAAGILVAIALVGGAVSTARQARLADQRFNEVRKLANSYLFEVNDAIERLPGATAARQLVTTRAQEYLNSLSKERINDPDLLSELAMAYEKLADVQGRRETGNIGDVNSAKDNLRRALALREQLHAARPRDVNAAMALSHSLALLGNDTLGLRELVSAEGYLRRAIAVAEEGAAVHPATLDQEVAAREALATACQVLGDVLGRPMHSNLGRTQEALGLYERALDLYDKNLKAVPAHKEKAVFIAATMSRIAQIRQSSNDGPGALAAYQKALDLYRALSEGEPGDGFYRKNFAVTSMYMAVALVQLSGDYVSAKALLDGGSARLEGLAREDPNDVSSQASLADSYSAQGVVVGGKNPSLRLRYFDQALARFEAIRTAHPDSLKPDASLTTLQRRTEALQDLKQYESAMASAATELAIDETLLRLSPGNVFAMRDRAIASGQMAKAEEKQGHLAAAQDWYRRSLQAYLSQHREGKLLPADAPGMAAMQAALDRIKTAVP